MQFVEVLREDEAVVPEFPHGDARCVDIAVVLSDCLQEPIEGFALAANLVLRVAFSCERKVELHFIFNKIKKDRFVRAGRLEFKLGFGFTLSATRGMGAVGPRPPSRKK